MSSPDTEHPSPRDAEEYVVNAIITLGPCTPIEAHSYLERLRKAGSIKWPAGCLVSEICRKLVRDGRCTESESGELTYVFPKKKLPPTQKNLF